MRQTDTEKGFDMMMAGVIVLFQSFEERELLGVRMCVCVCVTERERPVSKAKQRFASKQNWKRCYNLTATCQTHDVVSVIKEID